MVEEKKEKPKELSFKKLKKLRSDYLRMDYHRSIDSQQGEEDLTKFLAAYSLTPDNATQFRNFMRRAEDKHAAREKMREEKKALRIPFKYHEDENGKRVPKEEIEINGKVFIVRHTRNVAGEEYDEVQEAITAPISVETEILFEECENQKPKWHFKLEDEDLIGSVDDIVAGVIGKGRSLVSPDETRRIISTIISNSDYSTKHVYPAVGLYYNFATDRPVLALDDKTVSPQNDAARSVFESWKKNAETCRAQDVRAYYQAAIDFIGSMPEENRDQALLVRGYCFIAPLAYELKKTSIGIFPYLYLFGDKGTSKTQMAATAATYPFGENEMLTGQSVDSQFRLGIEFGATKFPRVVDEAHDVFRENQSIFKSGATSVLATKRGNKDKKIDRYPAFCAFIFTSNLPPIYAEDDSQGGVADRILRLDCGKGQSFNRDKYQTAMAVLGASSAHYGLDVLTTLRQRLESDRMDWFVREIMRLGRLFQAKNPEITLRRSYALAEIMLGTQLFLARAKENDAIIHKIEFELLSLIYAQLEKSTIMDEMTFVTDFVQFVKNVSASRDFKEEHRKGIYRTINRDFLVTKQTIAEFNRAHSIREPVVRDLADLERELVRFGIVGAKRTNNKNDDDECVWNIKINPQEVENIQTNGKNLTLTAPNAVSNEVLTSVG